MNKKIIFLIFISVLGASDKFDNDLAVELRHPDRPWSKWWWWNHPAYRTYPLSGYLWTDYGWKYNDSYRRLMKNFYKFCRKKNRRLSRSKCFELTFDHFYDRFYSNQ